MTITETKAMETETKATTMTITTIDGKALATATGGYGPFESFGWPDYRYNPWPVWFDSHPWPYRFAGAW